MTIIKNNSSNINKKLIVSFQLTCAGLVTLKWNLVVVCTTLESKNIVSAELKALTVAGRAWRRKHEMLAAAGLSAASLRKRNSTETNGRRSYHHCTTQFLPLLVMTSCECLHHYAVAVYHLTDHTNHSY